MTLIILGCFFFNLLLIFQTNSTLTKKSHIRSFVDDTSQWTLLGIVARDEDTPAVVSDRLYDAIRRDAAALHHVVDTMVGINQ